MQYLRADLRFGRTRAVLATLLGVSEHTRSYGHFDADEVRVVSRSGLKQVAFDGEMGEKTDRFPLPQARPADRLLLPHGLSFSFDTDPPTPGH